MASALRFWQTSEVLRRPPSGEGASEQLGWQQARSAERPPTAAWGQDPTTCQGSRLSIRLWDGQKWDWRKSRVFYEQSGGREDIRGIWNQLVLWGHFWGAHLARLRQGWIGGLRKKQGPKGCGSPRKQGSLQLTGSAQCSLETLNSSNGTQDWARPRWPDQECVKATHPPGQQQAAT